MSKFNDSIHIIKNIFNDEVRNIIKNSEDIAEKEMADTMAEHDLNQKQSLYKKTRPQKRYVQLGHRPHDLTKGTHTVINKITGIRSRITEELLDKKIHLHVNDKKYLFNCQHKITKKYKNVHIYDLNNDEFEFEEYDIIDIDKFNNLYEQFKGELKRGKPI